MRRASLLAAAAFAAALVFLAPSASADGAFITLRTPAGVLIGTRAPVSLFEAPAGQPIFEIDGATNVAAYFNVSLTRTKAVATVEFTTPDEHGKEEVTSIATFETTGMKTASLTFDAEGMKGTYGLELGKSTYTTAQIPTPAGAAKTSGSALTGAPRKLTSPLPIVPRTPVTAQRVALQSVGLQSAPAVDTVFVSFSGVPRFKLNSVSFGLEQVLNIGSASPGASSGKIAFKPFSISHGRAVTQFQQSKTSGKPFQTGTLSFVHTSPGGATTPVLEIELNGAAVKSQAVSSTGGVATEATTFEYAGCTITDPTPGRRVP